MDKQLENYQKQHQENYKRAAKDIIVYNTKCLFEEDLIPLFEKPPLDSMDMLKTRFVTLAKENGLVIRTEVLEQAIKDFRCEMQQRLTVLYKEREELYKALLDETPLEQGVTYKITIAQAKKISKQTQQKIKISLLECLEKYMIKSISEFFLSLPEEENIVLALETYLKEKYIEQMISVIVLKCTLRDNILVNNIKEQSTRYLFTQKKSRLFTNLPTK